MNAFEKKLADYLKRQAEGKTKHKPPKKSKEAIKTERCLNELEVMAQIKEAQKRILKDIEDKKLEATIKTEQAEAKLKEKLSRREKPVQKKEEVDENRPQINFNEVSHWNKNPSNFQSTQINYNGGHNW